MSKEELIAALQALEANPPVDAASRETASLIHDCEANQSDREVQNRQLREAEAQLERAVRRYMDLYDFAPIVYLTLDDKGLIQEANLTAAAFLETERTQLIGMQLLSLVAARHRAQLRAHLTRCVSQRSAISVELELSRSGIVGRPVNATSVPVFDDAGQVVGYRTALTDISALKRTEARLVLLASASKTLAMSLDVETAIQEALRAVLPACADLGMVDLFHRGEILRFEARREATEPSGIEIAKVGPSGAVGRTGQPASAGPRIRSTDPGVAVRSEIVGRPRRPQS